MAEKDLLSFLTTYVYKYMQHSGFGRKNKQTKTSIIIIV